jgi:hypothetical protein
MKKTTRPHPVALGRRGRLEPLVSSFELVDIRDGQVLAVFSAGADAAYSLSLAVDQTAFVVRPARQMA